MFKIYLNLQIFQIIKNIIIKEFKNLDTQNIDKSYTDNLKGGISSCVHISMITD